MFDFDLCLNCSCPWIIWLKHLSTSLDKPIQTSSSRFQTQNFKFLSKFLHRRLRLQTGVSACRQVSLLEISKIWGFLQRFLAPLSYRVLKVFYLNQLVACSTTFFFHPSSLSSFHFIFLILVTWSTIIHIGLHQSISILVFHSSVRFLSQIQGRKIYQSVRRILIISKHINLSTWEH